MEAGGSSSLSNARNGIFQVKIPDTGRKYVVDLKENECDYTNFQQYQSPCTHAIIACRHQ